MKRRLIYAGIITVLLCGALWLSRRGANPSKEGDEAQVAPGEVRDAQTAHAEPPVAQPLRGPPAPVAELGVLTDRPETELTAMVADREAVAHLLEARHCGDEAACAAVRRALLDEHTTRLQIAQRADWDVDRIDLDAATASLEPAARKSLPRRARIVAVRVTTGTDDRHLTVRTAFAAAAAIAEKVEGLVYDPLLARIESAPRFAAHAVTAPLGASAFRQDRVQLLYQPVGEGVVRVLTAGLSRWGAPDAEAPAVPTAASARVGDVVMAVAEALANGTLHGPVFLTRDDLQRARGAPYPADAGLPEPQSVSVGLVSVHPESGDPNDFVARLVPPAGEGPMGFLDLAERFFGPELAASPGEAVVRAGAAQARGKLGDALARWKAARAQDAGPKLLLRLPFEIPGEAGFESMWIEVTGFDEKTVRGRLLDEPLAATDVEKGQEVTARRGEVEEVRER